MSLFHAHSSLLLPQRCCYNANFNYETRRPAAGSFLSNHPWTYPAQNYRLDTYAKKRCCEDSRLCALYYDVRPTDECERAIVIIIGELSTFLIAASRL